MRLLTRLFALAVVTPLAVAADTGTLVEQVRATEIAFAQHPGGSRPSASS